MAGLLPLPVIQKEAWAQCENPNCNKWRKLPPGATINEDEPWYCYMNPDVTRNTCSASEVEYDENKEIVIDGADDPEEAARNRKIMEDLEASIAAAAARGGRGRGGRGRVGRGRGRGRGRPPLAPSAGGRRGGASTPSLDFGGTGPGRKRSVSFADDLDFEGESDLELEGAGRAGSKVNSRQIAKNLQRILENKGQWEASRGKGAGAVPAALPPEAWEAFSHAAPEAAELALRSADLASSIRYFENSAAGAEDVVQEASTIARLGTMVAASLGLADYKDSLTKTEREKLALDGSQQLPDFEKIEQELPPLLEGPLSRSAAVAAAPAPVAAPVPAMPAAAAPAPPQLMQQQQQIQIQLQQAPQQPMMMPHNQNAGMSALPMQSQQPQMQIPAHMSLQQQQYMAMQHQMTMLRQQQQVPAMPAMMLGMALQNGMPPMQGYAPPGQAGAPAGAPGLPSAAAGNNQMLSYAMLQQLGQQTGPPS